MPNDAKDTWCFGKESVEAAIAAIGRGELVIVVDDEDRENEGDLIMAALKPRTKQELATKERIAFMIKYTSGVLCCAIEGDRAQDLDLPQMVAKNEDAKCTAFTVSVDLDVSKGITTGISASGHIFPLRAVKGGVLARDGHTEATVDLARMAGLAPAGVLCEIVTEDCSEMMRAPELKLFADKHKLVLTSIQDMIMYRRETGK